MSNSSANRFPWPGVPEPPPVLDDDPPTPEPRIASNQPEIILTALREQIASGTRDRDTLLGAIAIAAQVVTDAGGAALGMRRDHHVACVGRSGETAPSLGARLSQDSGISGECLHTGRAIRCDDTETDRRVDAEVCRHLGLRSLAAVPVRSRLETIGILEVFSTSPQAFTDDHLTLLSRLAELADAANSPATAAVDVEPEEPGSWAGAETPIRMDAYVAGSRWLPSETPRKNRWRYLAVVGGVLLVALLSTASWRAWSELKSRGAAKPLSPSSQPSAPPVESSSVSPIASPEVKPSPEQLGSSGSARSGQKQRVVQAAQIEPDQGMIHSIQTGPSPARNIDNPNRPASAAGDASANEPPTVAMVSSSDSSLNGLLNGQKTLPTLDVKVSEGTTPLVVEHKVIPAYPRQALDRRMEGTVTVHINVNDRGRVAQVKLLNGDPILGKAAMDAVKQWRYHPVLLSGKPTATETDVLITFKLP